MEFPVPLSALKSDYNRASANQPNCMVMHVVGWLHTPQYQFSALSKLVRCFKQRVVIGNSKSNKGNEPEMEGTRSDGST
jgi:hypothetical protein